MNKITCPSCSKYIEPKFEDDSYKMEKDDL